MEKPINGILWYAPQTYDAAVRMMRDKNGLPSTYEKWHEGAEAAIEQAKRFGITMIPVEFDAKEFLSWCRIHGRNIDARARGDFANAIARMNRNASA